MKYNILFDILKELPNSYKLNSFEKRKYKDLSLEEIEEKAKLGEAEYQFLLFNILENKDINKALKYLELAFFNNHKNAQIIYIINLLIGLYGTELDINYAKEILDEWYNDLDLSFILALVSFIGIGEKDSYKAYKKMKNCSKDFKYEEISNYVIGEILLNKEIENKYLEEDKSEWIVIRYYLDGIKRIEQSNKIYPLIVYRLAELYSGRRISDLKDEEEFLYYKNLALELGVSEAKNLKLKKNIKQKKIKNKTLNLKKLNKEKIYQFVFAYGKYKEKFQGFINYKGEIIIEPVYIEPLLTEYNLRDNFIPLINEEIQCGVMNNRGEVIIPFEKADFLEMLDKYKIEEEKEEYSNYEFYENYCGDGYEIIEEYSPDAEKEMYGLKKGERVLFNCEYEEIFRLKPAIFAMYKYSNYSLYIDAKKERRGYIGIYPFENGYSRIIKRDNRFNFLNENFKEVFQNSFEGLGEKFKSNIIEFQVSNKMGIIDINGKIIIPPKYDKLKILAENELICVEYKGMKAYLDYNLKYVFRPDRDYITKIEKSIRKENFELEERYILILLESTNKEMQRLILPQLEEEQLAILIMVLEKRYKNIVEKIYSNCSNRYAIKIQELCDENISGFDFYMEYESLIKSLKKISIEMFENEKKEER